jgi:predicted GIY-YIG superfamily endonuclease
MADAMLVRQRKVSERGRITYFSPDDPHAIYYVFDGWDRVIYIGSSSDPHARVRAHRGSALWRREIARYEVRDWYPNRATAQRAEHALVWELDPDHNFVGTPMNAVVNRVFGEARRMLEAELRQAKRERIQRERDAIDAVRMSLAG